jgi:hypothetical protein
MRKLPNVWIEGVADAVRASFEMLPTPNQRRWPDPVPFSGAYVWFL